MIQAYFIVYRVKMQSGHSFCVSFSFSFPVLRSWLVNIIYFLLRFKYEKLPEFEILGEDINCILESKEGGRHYIFRV